MTSLIINMPHLQSQRQRHGAMLLSLLCWAWFLMPLVIVTLWLLGVRALAQQVVWLGGWKSLLHLSADALTIIASLTAAWGLWTLLDMRHQRARQAPVGPAVDAATALGADPVEVASALRARVTTVHFAPDGVVSRVEPDQTQGSLRPRTRARARNRRLAA